MNPESKSGLLRPLWTTTVGFGVLVFAATSAVTFACIKWMPNVGTPDRAPSVPTAFDDELPRYQDDTTSLTSEEQRRIEVFTRASASIVHIRAGRKDDLGTGDPNQDVTAEGPGTVLGAGFIWSASGFVLTNAHLIAGQNEVHVVLADGTPLRADFVSSDPKLDLAVLSVDTHGSLLPVLELGRSANVRVGQDALAIGSPLGRNHTLTRGLVSALNRRVMLPEGRVLEGAIQTDAPINPGNSGGPLLDSSGRVIGMVAALNRTPGADTQFNVGIGYAVPIDQIAARMPGLVRAGLSHYYDLEMTLCPDQWNEEMLQQADIEGVIPVRVDENSAAMKAGIYPLQPHNIGMTYTVPTVIVGVNGVPTPSRRAFDEALFEVRDHASILLDVRRTDLDYQVEFLPNGAMQRTLEPPFAVGDIKQVELLRRR
jgi:2-alkenal reductase